MEKIVDTKKEAVKAVAPAAAKVEAPKAAAPAAKAESAKKETVKKAPAKKTAAKKPAAKKAPAKKAATKKTATKAAAKKVEVLVQGAGKEWKMADIEKKVVAAAGKGVKNLTVYVKPEEGMAYYVADGEGGGSVEL